MTDARLRLPAAPNSVSAARIFVEDAVARSGARSRRDDAGLMTSELVTNAVLYARSPLEVFVSPGERAVRVGVRDDSPRLPRLMDGIGESMAGRGLHIVDSLADAWGAEPGAEGGKTVWFELANDTPR